MPHAHTPATPDGPWHDLGDHLRAVAESAAGHATPFGGAELARWAGLWHDLGKAHPKFQAYLRDCHRAPGRRFPTVDHKGAGTLTAAEAAGELAFLLHGHHGGLPDCDALGTRVKELRGDAYPASRHAKEGLAAAAIAGLPPEPPPAELAFPSFIQDERSREFFLRMLFSALIDADHGDTERHGDPEEAAQRGGTPDLAVLAARLAAAQAGFAAPPGDAPERVRAVAGVRDEVYRACLDAARLPPGFFRLTVPTGGGKTRSGLAFALQHALAHGLRRVVVAVPFLTITDQTAQVFRDVLGDDRAVLEHHSGASAREREADADGAQDAAASWRRLATQDWDAPVIVTTTVQLFESLFGRTTSACRKLHRLAGSVVILDEAQTLPTPLLAPILDGLRELVANYGASVVLCTATQPAFADAPGFAGLPGVREIAPEPPRLFATLKRVEYAWPADGEPWSWERAADELRAAPQALAVVNTKKDALALLAALDDPGAFHLSTLLCGAHRRDVLAVVRARLAAGLPCRLVSTQVVEAGVDLDFPLVLRALGPLDRIVQAAGRCNREGKLETGRVVVFRPEEGGMPPGPYRTAADLTELLLARGGLDPDDPATFEHYFRRLFGVSDLDPNRIQRLRAALQYREVADAFRMIEDDTASVLVRYGRRPGLFDGLDIDPKLAATDHEAATKALLAELREAAAGQGAGRARRVLTRAQPYLVSVRRREIERAQGEGLATELVGDVWEWHGGYDDAVGLTWQGRGADELVI